MQCNACNYYSKELIVLLFAYNQNVYRMECQRKGILESESSFSGWVIERERENPKWIMCVCYRTKCNQIDEMRFSYAIMTEACLLIGSTKRMRIVDSIRYYCYRFDAQRAFHNFILIVMLKAS